MDTDIPTYSFTFLGNGSYHNRGCEAIVRGTTAVLRKEFGKCSFSSVYIDAYGDNYDKLHEQDADVIHHSIQEVLPLQLKRFSFPWFERQFNRFVLRRPADVLPTRIELMEQVLLNYPTQATLLLGGDVATPGPGGCPEAAFSMLGLAKKLGSPVVFWGASIGPFSDNPPFERWMTDQLASIALVCVRETVTYQYLKSIGLKENLRLVADPAFLMQPEPFPLSEALAARLQEPCLGLNFSPLVGKNYRSIEEWIARVRNSIEQIAQKYPGPVILVPHVIKKNNNDFEFMHNVLESISPMIRKQVFLVDQTLNASQSKWLIGKMELFAGARTHSTIAALSCGVPTLMISYSAKSKGISQDMYDSLDHCVDANHLDPEEFVSKTIAMQERLPAIREQIGLRLPLIHDRAMQAARDLRSILQ